MLALRDKNLPYFDWNVSSTDAADVTLDKETIVENTLRKVAGFQHAVILFHDSPPKTTTVEALPEIIGSLKNRGYAFDTLGPDSFYVQFHHLGY